MAIFHGARLLLGLHGGFQPCALLIGEPFGFCRAVDEVKQHHDAEQQRRNRLQHEHPLPTGKAEQAVHLQQSGGDGRTQRGGERRGSHKDGGDLRTFRRREPVAEIEDDAGEETGFRHAKRFKVGLKDERRTLCIGAIDSAARGLVPALLNLFVPLHPHCDIHIIEDKTINLIPKLKSGWLDMIFIREPQSIDASLAVRFITRESCVLAVPIQHALADRERVAVADFQHEAMIIPDRRTRPHSHDLTMSLFKLAGFTPHIAQFAEEKQTILSLVAAGLGLAVVPASYRTMNSDSVSYIALDLPEEIKGLPLSIAWQKGNEDRFLREMLRLLHEHQRELTEKL